MKQTYEVDQIEKSDIKADSASQVPQTFSSSSYSASSKCFTSSVSSVDSGVFTICSPSKLESSIFMSQSIQPTEWPSYARHSYLDLRPLTLKERFHLARVHYVTVPNGIRLLAILVCLGLFVFVARTTLHDFIRHGTVVHLKFKPPNKSMPPAITICTHCITCL